MNLTSLSVGIGSIGPFSTRVFLPAFLMALLLRFGGQIPVLSHLGLLAQVHHAPPTWFTSDASLIILGVLTVVEIVGQKNATARTLLHEFDIYLKPALALLTSFGVLRSTDANFVQQNFSHAVTLDALIPLLTAIGTFQVARHHKQVANSIYTLVDGTHLATLFSWLEDLWAAFGIFFLVLFPILVMLLIVMATLALELFRRRIRQQEEQSKTPCISCGLPIYACAVACPTCRAPIAEPAALGVLGFTKPYSASDVPSHPYRLVEKRRCSVCAAARAARRPFQTCQVCGNAAMSDPEFTQAYIAFITRRLPTVLGVCLLLGLIPVVGLIVGIIYFQIELVLPFVQYLPLHRRFWPRLGLCLLFIVMIFFQPIPLLGSVIVPLMALISFTVYRNAYSSIMLAPPMNETGMQLVNK